MGVRVAGWAAEVVVGQAGTAGVKPPPHTLANTDTQTYTHSMAQHSAPLNAAVEWLICYFYTTRHYLKKMIVFEDRCDGRDDYSVSLC